MRTVVVTAIGSFSADIVIKKCRENGIRVIGRYDRRQDSRCADNCQHHQTDAGQTVVEKPPPDGLPVIFSSNVPIGVLSVHFHSIYAYSCQVLAPVCQSY
jgi:hypothetical protein